MLRVCGRILPLLTLFTGANYFDGSFVAGVAQTGDVLLGIDAGGTSLYNLTVDRDAGTTSVSAGTAIA